MNTSDRSPSLLNRLLNRTGGWYPLLVIMVAQLATSPLGIFLAAIPSKVNAELADSQVMGIVTVAIVSILVRNVILEVIMYATSRHMIKRLAKWTLGVPLEADSEEERIAWKQATSYAWRYMGLALASLFVFTLSSALIYMRFVLGSSNDQMIYISLAAASAGLGLAVLELLVVENLMGVVRQALLPQRLEAQVGRATGLKLLAKFILIISALVAVGVLLVGPVGYHQTVSALSGRASPASVISSLQSQLIIASISALLLGLALAYAMTRSISTPIRKMVEMLEKVESGDLTQRLPVTASDEVGELTFYFNRMIARLESLQTDLEAQVAFRTEQLRTTLEVGQAATAILDPDELISKVINLITDRFDYYYSAIFLVDSTGRWAELKNATGTAGQMLKERGHKLELGGKSMVSTAIAGRQARVALDVGAEPVRFNNPLLPDTRSEIALPLIVGEDVIGALDVQSTREAAFGEQEIGTLQGMANQLAVALENARLFQETQDSLAELRTAQHTYVTETWSEMDQAKVAYEYAPAVNESGVDGSPSAMDVPLTLREQTIGQLHLEGQQPWTAEERGLVEAVATQAALAMENARLLEESRQLALRERLAAEITGKVWASPNVDFILQTTIKELGRALRADEATIELKLD